ncbi:hypothetical protein [Brevundimonas sp.]|uniref:hypothetical protein n=1 Tax=Brevundimonas sp. TaxID=1871086 RepID=UPI001A209B12|nr:hypothetical protein [Brevundimonas sp.]MBJ7485455.1 hypothetical protein [Brevundimonas sp.]
MLIAILAAAALSGANDPEAVVATAPRGRQSVATDAVAPVAGEIPPASSQTITPHGLTTAQQIDGWIGQGRANTKPFADDALGRDPWDQPNDRKMHGEVFAAVGSGDYTSFGGRVSIPIGETGRVDLSYSESKNSPWGYGYGYGYPGRGPDALLYGPGYRGAYDPFFLGSGIVYPGRSTSFGLRYESDAGEKPKDD